MNATLLLQRTGRLIALATGIVALATAGILAFASRAEARPVALVTDVVGDVKHGAETLRLLTELDAGREIVIGADSTAVVFYVGDGSEWVLKGPGRYRLGSKGPEPQAGAPAAARRPAPAAFRDIKLRPEKVRQAAVIMRGRNLTLAAPVNDDVVVTGDVRLSWVLDNARDAEYEIELVDANGKLLHKARTSSVQFALPEDVRLVPGQRYTWAVTARERGLPQPLYAIGEFRVADAATRARVDKARPKADAPFSERVLFVALLEDVGAKSAAAEQRRALSSERPVAWSKSN
jgi:hypothetical protein